MQILYSFGFGLALLVSAPWWLARMIVSGKYREGLGERLTGVPARVVAAAMAAETVWVHAVSVGEVLAVAAMVDDLRTALAERGVRVVVSTTTRTGQALARGRFGADSVFYFPLDFPLLFARSFRRLNAKLFVLAETEFWPGALSAASSAAIPVVVVNARISDRSWPRYRRLRFLWRRILGGVKLFLAQSDEDAKRLADIGAPAGAIEISGNLKFDLKPALAESRFLELLRAYLPADAAVFVAGSTHEQEEKLVLSAHQEAMADLPNLITILAPRHPARFVKVQEMLDGSCIPHVRRSEWGSDLASPDRRTVRPRSIVLLDSIGELAAAYSIAALAFIGGSLVPKGGHNPLEPLQFGVPVIVGPYTENFREIMLKLQQKNAISVCEPSRFGSEVKRFLLDPVAARQMGERGRQVLLENQGATARTVEALLKMLPKTETQAAKPNPSKGRQ